ncbi:hypothetical protein [Cohnella sp. AR92]|uniref:hypothetical protein n=1 Tax=Cohnella sp. AR92 TaxID=648716 RepID=UPI001315502D|nr:hypothetical protein [Cohnella sp. AR92]
MAFFKRKADRDRKPASLIVYKPGFQHVVDKKRHELAKQTLTRVDQKMEKLGLR